MVEGVTESPLRLVLSGLDKAFGGTKALAGAELTVRPGEVHALLGENGAGKSTLNKIVSGVLAPDAGEMTLDGAAFAPATPEQARRAGVAIVHQEPAVCSHLSVAENVMLGAEPTRWGVVRRALLAERAERALALVRPQGSGTSLDPRMPASRLSAAELGLVCIARALSQGECRLLILDEPTASLSAADVQRLFSVVRRLKERGISVLYVSHFLEEVRAIADRYTVLRDGRTVDTGAIADVSLDVLVEKMAGRQVTQSFERSVRSPGEVLLALAELGGQKLPVSASLELRAGEVLGIAGLVGSGRSELLRAVFGLDRVKAGEVRVGAVLGPASPTRRLAQGVGLLSEDRKREGLAEDLTIADNLTLSKLGGLGPWGLVLPSRQRNVTRRFVDALGIRTSGPGQRARELSGGNQQKLALARLLHHDVDVLLLDEPTRGIDVASRFEVYRLIDQLAAKGKAVLVVSSQMSELLLLTDRIAVMHRGVLGSAKPTAELTETTLATEAAGA